MANSINKGNQILRIAFQQALTSRQQNQLLFEVLPQGILSGAGLSTNGTDVTVDPLVCLVKDSQLTNKTTLRIETQDSYTILGVLDTAPFIVLNFEWVDATNNYLDITTKAIGDINSDDIIVGEALFTGPTITGLDISQKSIHPFSQISTDLITVSGVSPKFQLVETDESNKTWEWQAEDRKMLVKEDTTSVGGFVEGGKLVVGTDTDDGTDSLIQTPGSVNSLDYLYEKTFPSEFGTVDPYTGSGELFSLDSPYTGSNLGSDPAVFLASFNGNSGFGKIFSGRSCYYLSGNETFICYDNVQLQNEDSLEMWIFPNWGAGPAEDKHLIDTAAGVTDSDNIVRLDYTTSNQYRLVVTADGTNNIFVLSDVIVSPNVLTHIKAAWSKSGNVAKLFVNGVDQVSNITVNNNGIQNMDLTVRSGICIGSLNGAATPAPSNEANMWLTDILIFGSYNISTAHYATGKQFAAANRKYGKNGNYWMDELGNFGAENGWFDDVQSKIITARQGLIKTTGVNKTQTFTPPYDTDSTVLRDLGSSGDIFDWLMSWAKKLGVENGERFGVRGYFRDSPLTKEGTVYQAVRLTDTSVSLEYDGSSFALNSGGVVVMDVVLIIG